MIKIDQEKCTGCGLCISTCQEGVFRLTNGKSEVYNEDYCDGLGKCLPVCPVGAIFIEEGIDTSPTISSCEMKSKEPSKETLQCGCPRSQSCAINRCGGECFKPTEKISQSSQLNQWPCQIKLIPVNAAYLNNSHLLITADCCAYAYRDFHNDFMRKKITLIGCPKLDSENYAEKFSEILKTNEIKSITLTRMEVPCCNGLVEALKKSFQTSGKLIPWQVVTISTDGRVIED
ncbi:MAG: ferredoxin family protein [Candidatus Cloacimonetes bacterium]|nr:ferredoxin family protein [Candidatus Cloacimonadota bacterium]